MITAAGRSGPESRRSSGPGGGEEWVLALVALAILLLPGLVAGRPRVEPRLERTPVEPLTIDVERAPWYEWALLRGIGEVRARNIVEFVEKRRPLESLDVLADVPGLPAGWLEGARPHLRLSPEPVGSDLQPSPVRR